MRKNKPSAMALLCLIGIATVSVVSADSGNSILELTRLTIPAEQEIDYGGLILQDDVLGAMNNDPSDLTRSELVGPYLNDFALTITASLAPTTADQTDSNFPSAQGPVIAKIDWGGLFAQDLTFLIVRNTLRLTDEDTREKLSGPFVEDWFDSVATLWNERARFYDNGKFFTNQIAHPWAGSTAAFIFANNDSISRNARFGNNKEYWRAKKRQFVFSVVDTLLFEIGPISESSLGNIRQGWIDLILTPTIGIAWSMGEDALKAKVLDPMYPKHRNWHNFLFIVLNPTRMGANLMAFRKPWYRD